MKVKINCRHQMSITLRPKQQTIADSAAVLYGILKSIAQLGRDFALVRFTDYGNYGKNAADFYPLQHDDATGAQRLAEIIIALHGKECAYHTGQKIITPEFSWISGFQLHMQYLIDGKLKYLIDARVGDDTINYFDQDYNFISQSMGFEWQFALLKAVVASGYVESGYIRLRNAELNEFARNYWYEMGWVNYFPHDYPHPVPDDLPGIEYEHTPDGRYLILTRHDFTVDVEEYRAGKQRIMDLMKEIERRVPGYRKAE